MKKNGKIVQLYIGDFDDLKGGVQREAVVGVVAINFEKAV